MIDSDEIDRLFREGFEHTVWRLESRRAYQVDYEGESYQRFLRGEEPARDPDRPWLVNMRKQTSGGKRVERVRLIDEPPTTYQRYGPTGVPAALEAGEDVRYLHRAKAEEVALAAEDFWLFDSRYVALETVGESSRCPSRCSQRLWPFVPAKPRRSSQRGPRTKPAATWSLTSWADPSRPTSSVPRPTG